MVHEEPLINSTLVRDDIHVRNASGIHSGSEYWLFEILLSPVSAPTCRHFFYRLLIITVRYSTTIVSGKPSLVHVNYIFPPTISQNLEQGIPLVQMSLNKLIRKSMRLPVFEQLRFQITHSNWTNQGPRYSMSTNQCNLVIWVVVFRGQIDLIDESLGELEK